MDDIYAVFKYPKTGYPHDRELVTACGFKIGERYLVDTISVGQSSTSVWLSGYLTQYRLKEVRASCRAFSCHMA